MSNWDNDPVAQQNLLKMATMMKNWAAKNGKQEVANAPMDELMASLELTLKRFGQHPKGRKDVGGGA
jgi:hypothetical protein